MSKPVPGVAFNLSSKNLIIPTAVITTTVIWTSVFWKVADGVVTPRLKKLADKLEEMNKNNK